MHDGHHVWNYCDVYALRKLLRRLNKDVSGLNTAVVTSVAEFLDIETSDAGTVFDII